MAHDWVNVERGLYQDKATGVYFERIRRPGANGKKSSDTWQSLFTTKVGEARERLDLRRAARQAHKLGLKVKTDGKPDITVSDILDRFEEDECPTEMGHKRANPGYVLAAIPFLRQKLGKLAHSNLNQARLDEYHKWRCTQTKKGDGDRTTDMDVSVLSVSCAWAARCGLIETNPIASHHRYVDGREVRHAKEVAFADMNEAHRWAGILFGHSRSESCAFMMLFACMFGSRTAELLALRTDASPEEPGRISDDGGP